MFERLAQGIGIFLLITAYYFVGLIIALPYTWFAAGTHDHFMNTIILSPLFVLGLIIWWTFCATFSKRHDGGPTFWITVVWLLLPPIMNGLSKIATANGYDHVGDTLFYFRYYSILAFPVLIIIVMAIYGFTAEKVIAVVKRIGLKDRFVSV